MEIFAFRGNGFLQRQIKNDFQLSLNNFNGTKMLINEQKTG